MLRYWKQSLKLCLVSILTVCLVFPVYATKTEINDAKDKVSSLEEEKQKVESALKELESLKSNTETFVRELDGRLATLNEELASLETSISEKEVDIEQTQQALLKAQEEEEKQYASMKLRIKYMYEKGETSYIDLLLGAESFTQLLNRAEYISQISKYDREMMDRYIATKEDIVANEKKLQEEHAALITLKESTQAKQGSVEALVDEKTRELKNYETRITTTQGELDEYQRDIQAQEARIKRIEAEIKRKEEEAKKAAEAEGKTYNTVGIGNINFIWPIPASKRITSHFGDRSSPTEGASTNHQGVDVGAPTGTDILAAASGTVTIATYSYSAGNYVMINHGGGVYTVYMHCSKLLVSEGQEVKQGQVIAKVGSTGYSTGPHLHFGIRVNGTYVNPIKHVSP